MTPISDASKKISLEQRDYYEDDDDSFLFDKPLEEKEKESNLDCLITKQDDIDLLSSLSARNSAAESLFRNSQISVGSSIPSHSNTVSEIGHDELRNNQNPTLETKR